MYTFVYHHTPSNAYTHILYVVTQFMMALCLHIKVTFTRKKNNSHEHE